jgi:hypothetical protein
MVLPRLTAGRVGEKRFACIASLSADETKHFVRDNLPIPQQSSWIPQDTQLKRKANSVLRPPPFADLIKVIIRQRVETKHVCFVGCQIKQGGALAFGQNGGMRPVSFACTKWVGYFGL